MEQNFYDICTEFFAKFKEVAAAEFYRILFQKGELQSRDESHNFKYNAIACEIKKNSKGDYSSKRFTLGDDLEHLDELLKSENFVIIAPMSYVGRRRTSVNARLLYALSFDLDGIKGKDGLNDLFFQMQNEVLPYPSYVANSGNGLHLYYVFEKPIPMFQSVTEPLEKLKHRLTRQIWNQYVTDLYEENKVQYEPIWQALRIVGGVTKDYPQTKHRVRCWEINPHPITLEYLNSFVPDEFKMPKNAIQYKSEMSLDEAKQKYPEWYERRILNKGEKKHWTVKPALYEWWLKRIQNETVCGKRYYCVMCLAIYAKKCGIPFEQLKKDAYGLVDRFEKLTEKENNHFSRQDIKDALKAYRDEFCTMPINSIVHFSGLQIQKNKRNGRTRSENLEIARFIRDLNQKKNGTKWNGRKSVQDKVFDFLDKNPKATCKDFCEQTDLKKSVFYKYKSLWQAKEQDEYKHYRNVFAIASIFDNCVKDAQTGQTIDLAELITGIPTPKEPLSYEEFLDMKSKLS